MWTRSGLLGLVAAMSLAGLANVAQAGASLFADLGERPGLERIVESATAVWVADSRIGSTFEDVNLVRFKRLLVEQLCQL